MYSLYCLFDTTAPDVMRYIGFAKDVDARFAKHLSEARRGTRTHKCNWIRSVSVSMRVLEQAVTRSDAAQREIELIREYRAAGHPLVNGSDGGYGGINPTPEVRAKVAAARRGRRHSAETRMKMSAAKVGKRNAAVAEANKRRVHSRESRAKRVMTMTGRKRPDHAEFMKQHHASRKARGLKVKPNGAMSAYHAALREGVDGYRFPDPESARRHAESVWREFPVNGACGIGAPEGL